MVIFICGGSKSGKSSLAESFSKKLYKEGNLIYIATMNPTGKGDIERIEKHREMRRGTSFKAFEVLKDVSKFKSLSFRDTVLLDSVTSLLANEMFKGETIVKEVNKKIIEEVESLKTRCKNLIVVSDYIGNDAINYSDFTRDYIKELAFINRGIVKVSDVVIEVSYGTTTIYKGEERLNIEKLI